jgi:glyoxylase-like metal-dependent hydrolase (beta-lactamase superfamily II)/rhodanese-related sulfurtransferase
MYFEQFYLTCLAHASYMLGSEGLAAVVDPQRDVELYLEEAARQGLKIAYVVETHLHADFVSGHRELAARTGATICVGARAGAKFSHRALAEGDQIRFGHCVLKILETPGHTPESLCVLVTDLERGPEPWAVLTGDTLFIGDVGRPDLSPEHTPQQLAGMLYDSLHRKLLALPDGVEVYPAHGAGSLCGRNISPERRSTIGKERAFNYALQPMSREEFVRLLTAELPDRPGYFAVDAEINRAGAAPLAELPELPALAPQQVSGKLAEGAVVLDTRAAAQFGAGHLPGAIHIALSGQYASWAGTLIGLDRPIVLVAEDPERLQESRMRLARVGIENLAGYLEGGVTTWERAGLPLGQVPQISVLDLYQQLCDQPAEIQVVDVRNPLEWESGHIAQATLKPLGRFALGAGDALKSLLADLSPAKPVAVHCKSGYRSSIATSLLERAGYRGALNVVGGFDAWQAHKLPVERSGTSHEPAAPSPPASAGGS